MPEYFDSNRISGTLGASAKSVLIAPQAFFSDMPSTDGYRNSLVFLTIVFVVLSLGISMMTSLVLLPAILPVALLFGFIATWMWAWYLGWACRVFCKAELSTQNAFQLCAYSSIPLVFGLLPVAGVIASLWNLYLNWQGLVSYARIGGGSAMLIIVLPLIVLGISMAVLVVLLGILMVQMGIDPAQLMNTGNAELF